MDYTDVTTQYHRWLQQNLEDSDLREELLAIEGNDNEIYERFYRELEFGTGGLRGIIGAGSNRMNIYTVRKATQGIADYLKANYAKSAVAISYDSRIKSDLFAKQAAAVLAANGIQVYLYAELMPTPALSFAVRRLNCQAGIMITASHNPSKYNGYKAYGPDGCQMNLEMSQYVLSLINKVDLFEDVKTTCFDCAVAGGMIQYISQDIINEYLDCVQAQTIRPGIAKEAGLHVVYTPLNGAGNRPVREILRRIGVEQVTIVSEQEMPDGTFATCPYPNPEIREALACGLELCEKVNPDLLLATDPDCDRVGIAVNQHGDYKLLTGNEVGALLLQYIATSRIENGTMPKDPVAIKTIVTTTIIDAIGKEYGIEIRDVLTGFKFIGEQIGLLEEVGEENRYIFGFEESYGYLAGTYVRDKDAVNASMLICEMAGYYKLQGKTLCDALDDIYSKYGRYLNTQDNIAYEGASGMIKMKEIMENLRTNPPMEVAGLKVLRFADYQTSVVKDCVAGTVGEILLPKSDVLSFSLENEASVIIRPSGTEPKIKLYYTTKSDTVETAMQLRNEIAADIKKLF